MNAITQSSATEAVHAADEAAILPLDKIVKREGHNPRKTRSAKQTDALRESIREKGVLQSILVRPHPTEAGLYEVVAGETRYELAKEVGLTTIPATIRHLSDEELTEFALTENAVRFEMSPIDEGRAAKQLLAEGYDRESVLLIMGWTGQKLDGRIQITHCNDQVAQALIDNQISMAHAQLLSGLRSEAQTTALTIIQKKGLTVEQFRQLLDGLSLKLASAPFDTTDCAGCPHNSSTQATLFDAGASNGQCLNKPCFTQKAEAHLETVKAELAESYNTVKLSSEVAQGTTTTVIASGPQGVGQEQLNACVSCEHYGAIIDTALGNRAKVTGSTCFNLPCHKERVKAYQNIIATDTVPVADESEDTPQTPTAPKAPTQAQAQATGKPASKPKAAKSAIPQVIVDRHHKIHREAAAAKLADKADLRTAQIMAILALMADSSQSFTNQPEGWPSGLSDLGRTKAATLLDAMTDDDLNRIQIELASNALNRATKGYNANGKDAYGSLAEWYSSTRKADLSKHFVMDADYLKSFTKPVIAQLLEASGFAKALIEKADDEKAFKTFMAGKKGDILEAVGKSDFSFKGFIPENLKIQ